MRRWLWLCSFALVACSGVDGVNGDDGEDGTNGQDGLVSRVVVNAEPEGANCVHGGVRVQTGLDLDRNGQLEAVEVDDTQYLCNGEAGTKGDKGDPGDPGQSGNSALVATTVVAANAGCPDGGVEVKAGTDDNANGTLEATEVDATSLVCNGADGSNGATSLTATANEPAGANCAAGGVAIRTGLDTNANQTLDANEVSATRYVCNATSTTPAPVVTSAFGGDGNPTYFTASQAQTILSAPITFPGPGKVVATGGADIYCETGSTATTHDCSTNIMPVYFALTDSAITTSTEFSTTPGVVYGFVSKDVTNVYTTTRVFDVTQAGTKTIQLRMLNDNGGELGAWRQRLTLVWLPN